MKIIFMPHRRRSRSWRRRRHRRQMVSRVERRVVVVFMGQGRGRKKEEQSEWANTCGAEKKRERENLLGNALCWTKRVVVEITEREREREQSEGKRAGEKAQHNNWIIINVLSSSNRAQAEHWDICMYHIWGILAKAQFSYSGTYRSRLLCDQCSCKQLL